METNKMKELDIDRMRTIIENAFDDEMKLLFHNLFMNKAAGNFAGPVSTDGFERGLALLKKVRLIALSAIAKEESSS